MLYQVFFFVFVFLQDEDPPIPCGGEFPPCEGNIQPPFGLPVPIDSATWTLIVAAIILAAYHFYQIWKSKKVTD